jgi:RHS repeat-associated protein
MNVSNQTAFATYQRDVGYGGTLDYALNRYYAAQWGRFTTPDPYQASAQLANPQSWNRYSYVENDPITYYDPLGLDQAVPCSQIGLTSAGANYTPQGCPPSLPPVWSVNADGVMVLRVDVVGARPGTEPDYSPRPQPVGQPQLGNLSMGPLPYSGSTNGDVWVPGLGVLAQAGQIAGPAIDALPGFAVAAATAGAAGVAVAAAPAVVATVAANQAAAAIPPAASLVIGSLVNRPGLAGVLTTARASLNFFNMHVDSLNRAINTQALLQVMARGKPILDAGPRDAPAGSYLAMERGILRGAGWTEKVMENGWTLWVP